MSGPAAVTVDGLSKRFRLYHERNQTLKTAVLRRRRATFEEFWALSDVSFEVPAGTTFGLVGQNGSGKSTLLKCMARILEPDAGRVDVQGKTSALLELGAGFHPELSGRENVFLNGSILGLSTRQLRDKFDEIVEFSGLERFIDTPVKNYSSGMYVRLGFAVAINVEPDVLLIDEVLAVGDEAFQRRCQEKLAEFRSSGRTIVVVSHALGSLQTLCDRLAWLEGGRLREEGSAGAVIEAYVGSVHTEARRPDGEHGGVRWGAGEARIERFELLGADGEPAGRLRTGDALTVRLHPGADRPVEEPIFSVTVSQADGFVVSETSVRHRGRVDEVDRVDYNIERLNLLPGTYYLSVALHDYESSYMHAQDVRHRVLRFDVDPNPEESTAGVVSLGGAWALGGAVRLSR